MGDALVALGKGFIGAFHPRMLLLTLMALGAAVMVWFFGVWSLIDPLLSWVHNWLMQDGQVPAPVEALSGVLGTGLKAVLVPLIVFFMLWPLVATTAVIIASVTVMPFVVGHVARAYPQLARRGDSGWLASFWQACKASAVFLIGWLVTLPLWLIPGAAFVLSFLWTAYLLVAVMSFDSLIEHATRDEFKRLYAQHSGGAWCVAIGCLLLNFLPPLTLLVPVVSALAFTHFYLAQLSRLRDSEGVWVHESA